ncbi:MAG: hypothetical protein ACI9UN_003427, partial [Granulosicoccus sp.]
GDFPSKFVSSYWYIDVPLIQECIGALLCQLP